MPGLRPMLALACAAVSLTVTAVLTAGPAAAAGANYVALGDSYSSGVGAGDYTSESGDCDRSPNAYSALWAAQNSPSSYTSVACSGATTSDVDNSQLSALSASTSLVSITIGGNDVGFSNIMETCVLYSTDDCVAAVNQAEATAENSLPGWLGTTYSDIAAAAPSAQGFSFGDVRNAFAGHQICDDSAWLHSLNFGDISESYHPTADGHAGAYLPVFSSIAG